MFTAPVSLGGYIPLVHSLIRDKKHFLEQVLAQAQNSLACFTERENNEKTEDILLTQQSNFTGPMEVDVQDFMKLNYLSVHKKSCQQPIKLWVGWF